VCSKGRAGPRNVAAGGDGLIHLLGREHQARRHRPQPRGARRCQSLGAERLDHDPQVVTGPGLAGWKQRSHAGRIEAAIQEATTVLRQDPSHVNANFNLGVFYLNSKPKQYQKAANQFEKVIKLTENTSRLLDTLGRARSMLDQVVKDAEAAGTPVKLNGGTL